MVVDAMVVGAMVVDVMVVGAMVVDAMVVDVMVVGAMVVDVMVVGAIVVLLYHNCSTNVIFCYCARKLFDSVTLCNR